MALFAGCGDDGGGALLPEDHVTLASLPQADRDAFAAWTNQVIKDCAWQQAFPALAAELPEPDGPYVADTRVDVRALLAATGGTRLVTGPAGELALLGPTVVDLGSSRQERSARHTVDGVTRVLELSATRELGVCVIRLGGEEVFRSELPAALQVLASYDPAVVARARPDLAALVDGRAGADAVAALDSRPLLVPAIAALTPSTRVHGMLAGRFAIDTAVAQRVFPLGAPRGADVARLALPDTTPFAPGARVFGPKAGLATIFAGGTVEVDLLFDGVDPDLIALRVAVAIGAGGKAPTLASITPAPHLAHDDAAARACFTARAVASRFEPEAARSPAFDEQFSGCGHLASDGLGALASDATTREAIARMAIAPGVAPFTYRNWDGAVIAIATRLAAQGVPLSALDPTGALPALTTVLARQARLRGAPDDPLVRSALDGPTIELAFRWLFQNVAPSEALLTDTVIALHNTAAFYPASVQQMLTALGDRVGPNDAGPAAVRCAVAMMGARRGAVEHALAAVAAVPHVGTYASELTASVLQRCPSADAVAGLDGAAVATTAFLAADEPRAGSGGLFALDAEPLVARALDEAWTAATFDALASVLDFALVSDATYCASHASRTEQVACVDPSLTRLTAGGDGILAPAVAARYAAMAGELTRYWPAIADSRFVNTRFDVTEAWSAGLWRGCDDAGFARSKQALFALLDRLRGATTFDDRFAIAQQITALVTARTCS